jgi:outer membrane protein OmpA-like peptidoglycan-associated protein
MRLRRQATVTASRHTLGAPRLFIAIALALPAMTAFGAQAQPAPGRAPRIAPTTGLAMVQTLHFLGGDRESVVTVDDASPAGVRFLWRFVEVHSTGDTLRKTYARFVSTADLAEATRLHDLYTDDGPVEHPSYTAYTLSTAVYRQLRAEGSAAFQIMAPEPVVGAATMLAVLGIGGARRVPVRWRGSLVRASADAEPFPLLVNGRRVTVPAMRLRGDFVARERKWEPNLWVLADSAFPLLLKISPSASNTENVLQTVRIDLPDESTVSGDKGKDSDGQEKGMAGDVESALASACRVELPGIYFGFNSASLDSASHRTIARLAAMLERHPEWSLTLEGHTDSIGGGGEANQLLSQRRAEAVLAGLTTRMGARARAIRAVGYGASRPREPNATIEGRARNRRVELVRDCETKSR